MSQLRHATSPNPLGGNVERNQLNEWSSFEKTLDSENSKTKCRRPRASTWLSLVLTTQLVSLGCGEDSSAESDSATDNGLDSGSEEVIDIAPDELDEGELPPLENTYSPFYGSNLDEVTYRQCEPTEESCVPGDELIADSGAAVSRYSFAWIQAQNTYDDPVDPTVYRNGFERLDGFDLTFIGVLNSRGPFDQVTPDENWCAFLQMCAVYQNRLDDNEITLEQVPQDCQDHAGEILPEGHAQIYLPADIEAWRDYVRSVVQYYGVDATTNGLEQAIRIWQLGLEYPRIWCWDESYTHLGNAADDFVYLMQQTREAILEVDPDALLMMPGIAAEANIMLAMDAGFLEGPVMVDGEMVSIETIRTEGAQALANNHALIDPLVESTTYDIGDIHLYGNYAAIPERAAWLRSLMPSDLPIWAGEGGGPDPHLDTDWRAESGVDCDDEGDWVLDNDQMSVNAAYVTKYYLNGLAGGVDVLCWSLTAHYLNWGCRFGDMALLTNDRQPRPSYYVFKELAQLIDIGSTVVDHSQSNVELYCIDSLARSEAFYVLWNDSETVTLDVTQVIPALADASVDVFRLATSVGEMGEIALDEQLTAFSVNSTPRFIRVECSVDCCQ